ncbi:MAG: flagellar basal body-associated protein FliL [Verrucomicrobiales bacterium]|nr:flagellar basal body-associated protein FliL [Verrucomicrobiales bacterium]
MANPAENKPEAAPAPSGGGVKAWLPLMVTILLMPALAFVMTKFVLLPQLAKSLGAETVNAREGHGEAASSSSSHHGEEKSGKEGGNGKAKVKVPLSKIVVNVSGSLGSRLLLASLTLAGNNNELKTKVEENTDQLRDMASSVLSTKTITDLEKPEARNLLRAELISQFNSVLGGGVQDIYITEFAIQ